MVFGDVIGYINFNFSLRVFLPIYDKKQIIEQQNAIINEGFYPVEDVMISSGYKEDEANIFKKDISGKEIVISFDFERELCQKNLYSFNLHCYC